MRVRIGKKPEGDCTPPLLRARKAMEAKDGVMTVRHVKAEIMAASESTGFPHILNTE